MPLIRTVNARWSKSGYACGMTSSTNEWLRTPVGQRVYALERKHVGEALAHVFGWQLLQIGEWGSTFDQDSLLAESRTQQKSVVARRFDAGSAERGGRTGRIVSR